MTDKDYWNSFYAQARPAIQEPTGFAHYCMQWLGEEGVVYELGCGNGRDSLFFAATGLQVIACDRSEVAIGRLAEHFAANAAGYRHRPRLVVGEMGNLEDGSDLAIDAVYSRFTLHAVSAEEASNALRWAFSNLVSGGRLFIEARTVKGSLFGLGEEVAPDTFLYNDHTRRFIRSEELLAELEALGFAILEWVEADGLAVYKNDDPVAIRVVAEKRTAVHATRRPTNGAARASGDVAAQGASSVERRVSLPRDT